MFAQTYDYDFTTTTSDGAGLAVFAGVWLIVWLAVAVLGVAAMWKIFTKAKQPGWAAIVPIYNVYILLKVVGRPGWWLLLFLLSVIPFVGWLVVVALSLIIALDLGRAFGKDTVFSVVGLWLFSLVGYLILGFGDAKYLGPKPTPLGAAGGQATPPASKS